MKKLSIEEYLAIETTSEDIAITVKNGKDYFVAWIEAAENYNVVASKKPIRMAEKENIYDSITQSEGWQTPCATFLISSSDPKEALIMYLPIKGYDMDLSITAMTEEEWKTTKIKDDGNYIITMKEVAA